jgi:hypothetical protein
VSKNKDSIHIKQILMEFYGANSEEELEINRDKFIRFFQKLDEADRKNKEQQRHGETKSE